MNPASLSVLDDFSRLTIYNSCRVRTHAVGTPHLLQWLQAHKLYFLICNVHVPLWYPTRQSIPGCRQWCRIEMAATMPPKHTAATAKKWIFFKTANSSDVLFQCSCYKMWTSILWLAFVLVFHVSTSRQHVELWDGTHAHAHTHTHTHHYHPSLLLVILLECVRLTPLLHNTLPQALHQRAKMKISI